ncbi:hypothetical protein [Nonomuraea sp. NPDC049400]|uniref:hypothetical protein n=1 Tax=Nonomuraea sp. NPDC049400 TaxID=3364352 RepID=UPI00379F0559
MVEQQSGAAAVASNNGTVSGVSRPKLAALRLRRDNITLPPLVRNPQPGEMEEPVNSWGELHLLKAAPYSGREWTDTGTAGQERALKHRAAGHSRTVPIPPPLVRILS